MSNVAKDVKLTGIYAVLLMGVLNSLGQALVFEIGKNIHVLWIIGIQSWVGFLVVLVLSIADGKAKELSLVLKVPGKSWLLLHARALLCVVGGLGLIYHSYQYLPLSIASWFMAVPLATFWAYILLRERITRNEFFSLLISFIGLVFISTQKGSKESASYYIGFIFICSGVLLFSLGWVLSKPVIKAFGERNFNILSNATIGFYGTILALVFIEMPELDTRLIGLLIIRGFILGVVSILFARTIKCLTITKGLILARLENVYAVIIGVSIFSEEFSLMAMTGAMLLIVSTVLTSKG